MIRVCELELKREEMLYLSYIFFRAVNLTRWVVLIHKILGLFYSVQWLFCEEFFWVVSSDLFSCERNLRDWIQYDTLLINENNFTV